MFATRGPASWSTRSTARTASRPRRWSPTSTRFVVDLQDVGCRIYTFIYTMANCMRRRRKISASVSSSATVRTRSTATRSRATITETRIQIVCRPIRAADAARDDDRRAGENVQRTLWHRLRSRGRRDGRLATRDVGRRDRSAVDASVAEHSDRRHLRRLSRDRPHRGHRTQRRPRHDTAIFPQRSAVHRRLRMGRRAAKVRFSRRRIPRSLLPPDVLPNSPAKPAPACRST